MIRSLIAVSATVALVGCAPPPGGYRSPTDNLRDISISEAKAFAINTKRHLETNSPEAVMEQAKQALAGGLKDPASAQFRNVRLVSYNNGAVVCGEVNGKNSYGGYVGFKPFVASPAGSALLKSGGRYPEIDAAANAGIFTACSGPAYVPEPKAAETKS